MNEDGALRILHLSDSHLFGDGALHYDAVDTLAALRRVLARAEGIGAIDVVVVSGDLSNDGSTQSYRLLRGLVEPWAAARAAVTVYAMGNHDDAGAFEEVLGARTGVREVAGFRIVTLDSSIPGAGFGQLGGGQLSWLREVLAVPAQYGTIVVIHHPPVPAETLLLSALELQRPRDLIDVCADSDVRLILCGHYHHPLVSAAGGIPVVVAPGIANTSDVVAPAGVERATVGSGFALVEVPRQGAVRATFVAAPSPEDGLELFSLGRDEVARIAREAGPRS
jgi:3',5'-cyclic-AMP phosphodiesterase